MKTILDSNVFCYSLFENKPTGLIVVHANYERGDIEEKYEWYDMYTKMNILSRYNRGSISMLIIAKPRINHNQNPHWIVHPKDALHPSSNAFAWVQDELYKYWQHYQRSYQSSPMVICLITWEDPFPLTPVAYWTQILLYIRPININKDVPSFKRPSPLHP